MNQNQESLTHPDAEKEEKLRRVELWISTLLRTGVILSLLFIVTGTIVSFSRHHDYVYSSRELQQLTQTGASFPYTLRDVVEGLKDVPGRAIVTIGLLLLIATPIIRVAVSIAAFIYQKDKTYTLITISVFCLLLLSFFLGAVE